MVYFNNTFENGSADKIISICNKHNEDLLKTLYKKINYIGKKTVDLNWNLTFTVELKVDSFCILIIKNKKV